MCVKVKKLIAVVLSIVMLLGIVSSTVTALGADITLDARAVDVVQYVSDEIVEIDSLREANVKHFRLPDGSYEAVVYSHSVHRKDQSGKWIDIDNSITEETADGVKQYSTSDERIKLTNNDNDYPVLVLADKGCSVTMEFMGDASSSAKKSIKAKDNAKDPIVTNTERTDITKVKSFEDVKRIDNQSSIRYEKVKGNTDIEYVLIGNDVKENIILHSVADTYSYNFKLELHGLIPVLNEDETISLNDVKSGETKYLIPAPYMYDSLGAISFEVKYTLTETSSQTYLLTILADENWINSAERVFPVTIDPTIQGDEVVFDTYISSANKDQNYGESEQVWISSTRTAFIQIDPPYNIPEGSTITHATLNLPFYYHVTDGDLNIGAYEILYPWDEYEVTWNIANENPNLGISPSLISTANLAAEDSNGVDDPGIASLNITSLMQGWIDGEPNYGVALKYISGTNASVIIRSWEIDNSAESYYRVTYYPLIDMSLTTNRMGVDGTQQVNYSTYPSGLTPTWSSSNTSVATISSSGVITAHGEGSTLISASCYDSQSGNTYTDSSTLYVYDSTGIKNNTSYYIMNYSSKRLLSLESASDLSFTNVFARVRGATALSQWTTEQQTDGRYQLISDYSSTGKCLDVTDGNVDIFTSIGREYQKFTIDRVESGAYQGLYLIRCGDKYVAQDSDYNVYVTTTRSAYAYWSFMAVNNRYANYYSISNPNTNGRFDDYRERMMNLGYTSNNWHCTTAQNAYSYLSNTNDVFTFIGHGLESSGQGMATLCFETSLGEHNGYITANSAIVNGTSDRSIDNLPTNALALERCVLYLGCKTGQTYTVAGKSYNLVQSTYKKGAHFVLGTNETISVGEAYAFLDVFLENCATGTIYDSISSILGDDPLFDAYYVGDSHQYLSVE